MKIVVFSLLFVAFAATKANICETEEQCSSLQVAKRCGVVQKCINGAWMNYDFSNMKESEFCMYCEEIVGDIRAQFSTANEKKVKDYFDKACAMIPEKEIADQCQKNADEYINEVFQMVKSQLDPKAVCSALGLCPGFKNFKTGNSVIHRVKLTKVQPQLYAPLEYKDETKGDVCADCKVFITDIKNSLTTKATEKEVEDELKKNLCAILGVYVKDCDTLVDAYAPQILAALKADINPAAICAAFGVCKGDKFLLHKMKIKESRLYKQAQNLSGAETCAICESVFEELKGLIIDQSTQQDIENFLKKNLCTKLGTFQKTCEEDVTQYGPIIFQLLQDNINSSEICNSLGFCASKKHHHVSAGTKCVLCEFIMKEIDQMLSDSKTEAEIIAAVETVCDVLPSTIRKECQDFIEEYGQTIITLLKDMSPATVCSTLGLCNQKRPVAHKVAGAEECVLCKTVIQYLDSFLSENATEAEIEQALEKVCKFVPKSFQSECDDFIKEYAPLLIQLIEEDADPETVCKKLDLCSAVLVQEPIILPQKAQMLGVDECTYGPSYWCATYENAKKCKATKHCEQHIWKNGVPRL